LREAAVSGTNSNVKYRLLDRLGFPGYRVGDDGSVWTCYKRVNLGYRYGCRWELGAEWRRLRQRRLRSGYMQVVLAPGAKMRCVHRLVLEAFVGPCPAGMEACHSPDPDRANNRLTNLRWDTRRANIADRDRHGRTARGERSGGAKLTEAKVAAIRAAYVAGGVSKSALGRRYGVCPSAICRIIEGKSWCHTATKPPDA
jgi:hypothetical protein